MLSLVAVMVAAIGVGSAHPVASQVASSTSGRHGPAQTVRLVGLGDSITAGTECPDCATFIDLYGTEITGAIGRPVTVTNLGVSGWTSADLLRSLTGGGEGVATVRAAKVITVTIGANDFAPMLATYLAGDCGGADKLACFDRELATLRTNLTAILARIHGLRANRPTAIRVTGYWNVFIDGAVAAQTYGVAFEAASTALTVQVNRVIQAVAQSGGATYVDLFTPFKGPRGDGDPTSLLAVDGEHPNQAGHQEIAEELALAGYAPLRARS